MFNRIPVLKTFNYIYHHPMFHGSYFNACMRFFRWHLGLRVIKHPILIDYVGNTKIVGRLGIRNTSAIFYVGLIEADWGGFILHYLRKDDTFFDVGANIGAFTILSSCLIKCKTVSFEPIPETFEYLKENISLNHAESNLVLLNEGVGSCAGEISFTTNLGATNSVIVSDLISTHTVSMPVTTLDIAANVYGIPSVIKIDVEGYESEVIKGAEATLMNPLLNVVLIELRNHGAKYGFNELEIHNKMKILGFNAFKYDPIMKSLISWKRESDNVLGDIIYIRNVNLALERIKSAQTFKVRGDTII